MENASERGVTGTQTARVCGRVTHLDAISARLGVAMALPKAETAGLTPSADATNSRLRLVASPT